MNGCARRILGAALALASGVASQESAPSPRPAVHPAPHEDVAATPRTAAWLRELLGPDPRGACADYQRILDDQTQPREQRAFAAARLFLLQSGSKDPSASEATIARLAELQAEAGRQVDLDALAQRLRRTTESLRDALAKSPGQPDLAQLRQAFDQTPLPPPAVGALRAIMQDADASGERRSRTEPEEPGRGRGGRVRDLDSSPRGEQMRRWIRDALQSELAGEADKARRLRGLLVARGRGLGVNAERGGLNAIERQAGPIMQRIEERLNSTADSDPLTPRERALLTRAIAEAKRRIATGDLRGAYNLLWPAAQLDRGLD
jgi:hypothetical protein